MHYRIGALALMMVALPISASAQKQKKVDHSGLSAILANRESCSERRKTQLAFSPN